MMNRTTFGKKNLNKQRPRVDRFITPREHLPDLCRKLHWGTRENPANDLWYTKFVQQKMYANYLGSAFGLEPQKARTNTECDREEGVQMWPCRPRKKNYLSSADSILDLPNYSQAAFPDLLDWSNDNILVAALGIHYHKWSWRTQSQISQGYADSNIQCCKFDPNGKLLLLGTDARLVEVHDTEMNKCVNEGCCRCILDFPHFCSITAMDWSPTGNAFITGCTAGMVVSYDRQARVLSWWDVGRGAILIVRVSPDARYVSVAAVNDNIVLVYTWPLLQPLSNIKSDWTVKALWWHPWRAALLGVGAVSSDLRARVVLWDAPTNTMPKRAITDQRYSLDAMLFSDRTGELVLSLWDKDRESSFPKGCSQLVVMSDPDTVVDQWGEGRTGLDRVRTMVFSPDGTKLATATSGEDLIIWNFLPEDKVYNKKKKYSKEFCALPVYLDKSAIGVSYR